MLFSVVGTPRSRVRWERRAPVQQKLFDNRPKKADAPPVWEHLGPDERRRVVAVLVRAMRAMVLPERRRVNDE